MRNPDLQVDFSSTKGQVVTFDPGDDTAAQILDVGKQRRQFAFDIARQQIGARNRPSIGFTQCLDQVVNRARRFDPGENPASRFSTVIACPSNPNSMVANPPCRTEWKPPDRSSATWPELEMASF